MPAAITHIDPQEVIAAYISGKSARTVGAQFGVTDHWVFDTLRRHGIKIRSPGTYPLVPAEKILDLAAQDLTCADISFITGLCVEAVRHRLTRLGIRK